MKQQCEEGKQRFGLLPPIYYYMPMSKDNDDLDPTYYEDDDSLPAETFTELHFVNYFVFCHASDILSDILS
jgi:hypothetical protein